jgi:hypothetical protein
MKEAASSINEIKRKKENERIYQNLKEGLETYEGPDVSKLGEVLYAGKLLMFDKNLLSKNKSLKGTSFSFFLFPEVMMYCKETKRSKGCGYKFKGFTVHSVSTLKEHVVDLACEEDLKLGWELSCKTETGSKNLVLNCFSIEDKEMWVNLVSKCIKKNEEKSSSEKDAEIKLYVSKVTEQSSSDSLLYRTMSARVKNTPVLRGLSGKKNTEDGSQLAVFASSSSVTSVTAMNSMGKQSMSARQSFGTMESLRTQLQHEMAQKALLSETVTRLTKQLEEFDLKVKLLIEENEKYKELISRKMDHESNRKNMSVDEKKDLVKLLKAEADAREEISKQIKNFVSIIDSKRTGAGL